jgi:hypothetical protein
LLTVYVVGFAAALVFNTNCYPGTFVGRVGWAVIWPLSVFGYLVEYGLQFENAILREGCFLLRDGATNALP